jgi:superfamily II DNA or RNA helicase
MTWLTPESRLKLQQLRLLNWAETRFSRQEEPEWIRRPPCVEEQPQYWHLTYGLELHPWQEEAVRSWFEAGRRGTIKVVTGAGKTLVALAIAERLQREDPNLRVAVIVPTIVLMNQWYEELLTRSNLPTAWIGRLGGGHQDDFENNRKVLVTVLASARKLLQRLVHKAGIGRHLLLIADECHRAGAPEMSAVLKTECAYSLGLSATPERDDEGEGEQSSAYEQSPLGKALGGIVYEMTVARAVDLGVLPPFQLEHYGLALTPRERHRYEELTRSLSDLRDVLHNRSAVARRVGTGEALLTWCRTMATRGQGELANLCARYVAETLQRKRLLYGATARRSAAVELLRRAFNERPDTRAILFHESIDEVVTLFGALEREGLPVVMEHSDLPEGLRDASLDLFRHGIARIVVSARSLIEGFNVPTADLGIIVASSTSTRQRIQSIGRVLRKYRFPGGEEKTARICVLYMRDTVDEVIYEKADWDRLLGVERNLYFIWTPPGEPELQPEPPRPYVPNEHEVNVTGLKVGDPYPGRYEGIEYTCDTLGNVIDAEGRYAKNPQDVWERVIRVKGEPGRFRVTPHRRLILARTKQGERWQVHYAGRLAEPFEFESPEMVEPQPSRPGDPYRGPLEPCVELRFRQKGGGVVAKRVPAGEAYARGRAAEELVAVLRQLSNQRGRPISKFFVNAKNEAYWLERGKAFFITSLPETLGFPGE